MAEEKGKSLVDQLAGKRLPVKKAPTPPAAGGEPGEQRVVQTRRVAGRTLAPEYDDTGAEGAKIAVQRDGDKRPITEFYKLNGKEYTLEELRENGMLPKMVTTYEQHHHLQNKHLDYLKEIDALKKAVPAVTEPRTMTDAEVWATVKAEYAGRVASFLQKDGESGEIEPELNELYPETLKTLYTRILFQEDRIVDLRHAVYELQAATSGTRKREVKSEIEEKINRQLDTLTASDDVYGLLADADTREGFIEYLFDLNPSFGQVSGGDAQGFLAKQWFAYNAEALKAGQDPNKGKHKKEALLIGGEGPSSRPGQFRTEEATHLDQLASTILPVPQ